MRQVQEEIRPLYREELESQAEEIENLMDNEPAQFEPGEEGNIQAMDSDREVISKEEAQSLTDCEREIKPEIDETDTLPEIEKPFKPEKDSKKGKESERPETPEEGLENFEEHLKRSYPNWTEKQTESVLNDYRKSFGIPLEPKGGPSMADLRSYMEINIQPGQQFTSRNICDGLGAYQREEKKTVYKYLSRLAEKGIIKKDKYLYGGFRMPLEMGSYDLGSNIQDNREFGVKLPLDLHNLLKIEPSQLLTISGRYDAGKSAFLWHTAVLNYEHHKIIHFSSPEWDVDAIKTRMDELGIPRPHPNVTCYPIEQGYEDLIPSGPCIVLVDYLRAVKDFSDIDRQFYRILENLNGGICLAAIQKHPGLDRPLGGQFGVHAPHHVILLDKFKRDYLCKIFKTKSENDLEGLFRFFTFTDGRQLVPQMDTWKKGELQWDRPKEKK